MTTDFTGKIDKEILESAYKRLEELKRELGEEDE